ncbi:MAG: OmpH family outer membrane protein [Phycisphaerales bacterium]|jgi:hypothetical protein
MTIRSNAGLWNTAIIGVAALMAAPALAQVQDVAPYYAVVQGKQALRSRDGERFYSVADLADKAVVIVDGEGKEWARVYYPAGLSAFVRAEDVTVEGSNATLAKPSKLKAANAASGYSGSYMSLFTGELAPGTVLKVMEPAKENDGPVVGYRVAAPEGSKGYVEIRTLRRATDGEAAAARAKGSVGALPNSKPGDTKPTEAKGPETKPAETAVSGGDKPAAPAVDLTATPTTPAGDKPVEVVQKTDPNSPAGATPPATAPAATSTEEAATPSRVPERKVSDLERLEPTFREVWKQPILNAEFDELLSEYERALADVPSTDARRRQQVQARIDALTLRQDFRNKLREQEDAKSKLDQNNVKLKTQLDEIAKSRYYTIIGQLQPSLVYNGRDLPQMYRVVSVGGTAPRTLGYLMKTDKFDLQKMVGMVVGVIGEAQLDRSLQLNIITPVQVDMLKSVPVPAMATPPADSTPADPKAPAEEQPTTDAPMDSGGQ